jgi:hypothetical protein
MKYSPFWESQRSSKSDFVVSLEAAWHHRPSICSIAYAARFTFAHLARCAAAIRLRPATEIVRFGLAALSGHRAFCVPQTALSIFDILPSTVAASGSESGSLNVPVRDLR